MNTPSAPSSADLADEAMGEAETRKENSDRF